MTAHKEYRFTCSVLKQHAYFSPSQHKYTVYYLFVYMLILMFLT